MIETKEDVEGAILEKAYLCERAFVLINDLYKQFISIRVRDKWVKDIMLHIRKWVES